MTQEAVWSFALIIITKNAFIILKAITDCHWESYSFSNQKTNMTSSESLVISAGIGFTCTITQVFYIQDTLGQASWD